MYLKQFAATRRQFAQIIRPFSTRASADKMIVLGKQLVVCVCLAKTNCGMRANSFKSNAKVNIWYHK